MKREISMVVLRCIPSQLSNIGDYGTQHRKLVTVFLGTYTFIFIGCGSLYIESRGEITMLGVALAWGAALAANIYTFGHISGGHVNPALTLAYAVAGQFPWKQVPLFVIAELLGSTAASFTIQYLFFNGEEEKDYLQALLITRPLGSITDVKAMLLECIITFIYTLANCGSRADTRAFKELGGAAVGATMFFLALVAGKITGASMNPARSLGPAIMASDYHKIWIYIISPVIGAVAGTTLYFLYLMPNPETSNDEESGGIGNVKNKVYIDNDGMDPISQNSIHLEVS